MRRKSLIVLALSAACLLSMTACGTKKSDNTEVNTEQTVENQTESTEGATEDSLQPDSDIFALGTSQAVSVCGQDLTMTIEDQEEEGDEGTVTLTYGNSSYEVGMTMSTPDGFVIIDSEDSFRLIVTLKMDNDWTESALISYSPADGFTACDSADGCLNSLSELTKTTVTLHGRTDCFGTYGTTANYDISQNSFVCTDDMITFENEPEAENGDFYDSLEYDEDDTEALEFFKSLYDDYGRKILTVKTAFTAQDDAGQATEIPAGSVLYPTGCSTDKTVFYFTMEDKTYSVECSYETDSYGYSIDGVSEEDIFVSLPYAG